jgi:hypothetical protein
VLDSISTRGRLLAAYDIASWHATDAVQALKPPSDAVNASAALQQPDGTWRVHFGHLTAARDTFYSVYEAVQQGAPESFTVVTHDPPQPLLGQERLAAAALQTGSEALGPVRRPYNGYALLAPGGEWWVYMLPAPTRIPYFPHGGDERYRISADGLRVLETRRMHRAVLEFALPDSVQFGYHTAVMDIFPEDSDVFLVLRRTPQKPELIVSDCCFYHVHVDGSITWRPRDD